MPKLPFVALLITLTACGGVQTRTAPTPSTLGGAELRGVGASNVYDAITRLRPEFFSTRGMTSFINEPSRAIVVVVNHMILGGVEQLRDIDPRMVQTVRRLNASEVYRLTGQSAPSGGIEIVLGS